MKQPWFISAGPLLQHAFFLCSACLLRKSWKVKPPNLISPSCVEPSAWSANPGRSDRSPWLQEAARDVTSIGSVVFLGFVLLAGVGYLLLTHKRALAVWMAVSVVGGELLSTILKTSFDRPRPDIPHVTQVFTASFPAATQCFRRSRSSQWAPCFARKRGSRLKRYSMGLAVFLTVAVGVSRVYLAVHYPTDVLAGWCIGSGWAILCWTVASWFQPTALRRS